MRVLDLGRMEYMAAWEEQLRHMGDVMEGAEDALLLVEHDPVLTLGASFHEENLVLPAAEYERQGIAIHRTDRGGDVTYHGPGQLTIYPIFNLEEHGRDLHKWLRDLEETMIRAAASLFIVARRFPPHTGVWAGDQKFAAIGIKVKRWVSTHGIALNCDNDLAVYETFVPCGIREYGVTSLTRLLGQPFGVEQAKPVVVRAFQEVFS